MFKKYLIFILIFSFFPYQLPHLNNSSATASIEKFTNTDFETDLTDWGQASWWKEGGVSTTSVVAAYQPKSASSLSASYSNVANPGVYDITPGIAPTWDAINGWKGDGNTTYLNTGIYIDSTHSAIVRFSSTTPSIFSGSDFLGMLGTNNFCLEVSHIMDNKMGYWWGNASPRVSPFIASGTLALTPTTGYRNGVFDVTHAGVWTAIDPQGPLYLLASNLIAAGGMAVASINSYVQAVAIYNNSLSADQVLAIHKAMMALDSTTTRDTLIKHSGTASAKIIAANDFNFVQSVNVENTLMNNLIAYVYTDGSAVTSSDVELYADGSVIATTFTDVGDDWYKLSGTITGTNELKDYGVQIKSGKTIYLDDLSLSVVTPAQPSISISSPTNNTTISGNSITITASATANSPAVISSVQFLIDGANFGSAITSAPYSTSWDTTQFSDGNHTISAITTDNYNNETTATTITVNINNSIGGMPAEWHNSPKIPTEGFGFLINNGSESTSIANVILNLRGGPDTIKMAISNSPDFKNTGLENYSPTKTWNICWINSILQTPSICPPGIYTVYAKYYTPWGMSSEIIFDTIDYKTNGIATNDKLNTTQIIEPFMKDLKLGQITNDVKQLQIFLNTDSDTQIAQSGPGSPKEETNFFGQFTKAAVIKFQEKFASEILTPLNIKNGTGFVGKNTRLKINKLLGF